MIIDCQQCGSRFQVADEVLGPKGRKLKCSRCQHIFFQAPAPPPTEPPQEESREPVPALSATGGFVAKAGMTLEEILAARSAHQSRQGGAAPAGSSPSLDSLLEQALQEAEGAEGEGLADEEGEGLVDDGSMAGLTSGLDDEELEGEYDGDALEGLTDGLSDEVDLSDEGLDESWSGEVAATGGGRQASVDELDTLLQHLGPLDAAAESDEEGEDAVRASLGDSSLADMAGDYSTSALLNDEGDDEEGDFDGLEEIDLTDKTLLGNTSAFDSPEEALEEIDLTEETLVAPRGRDDDFAEDEDATRIGLNADEEDALSNLGFRGDQLSSDEEDALASLGMGSRGGLADEATQYGPSMELGEVAPYARRPPPDYEDEAPLVPTEVRPISQRFPLPGWLPWLLAAVFLLTMVGGLLSKTFLGDWVVYKRHDLLFPFRLEAVRGEWRQMEYGQLLIVRGKLANSARLTQEAPVVRVSLLDQDNATVETALVIPGRLVSEEDLEKSPETLRIIIQLQKDVKRLKLPKLPPEKGIEFQAIFLDPPGGAVNYQVDMEHRDPERALPGGVKNFQTAF